MALWRLYYHLVWATKERQPLIAPDKEPKLYSYLTGKADALGSIIHAIGGIENHNPSSSFHSTQPFYCGFRQKSQR